MFRIDTATDQELTRRRDGLAAGLAAGADYAPGSLHRNYRKCGKSNCRCARDGDPGHGPRHVLVRGQDGKPRTTQVPAPMAAEVAEGVAAYQRFTAQVAQITAINAELTERRLRRAGRPAAPGGGGSRAGTWKRPPPAPSSRRR